MFMIWYSSERVAYAGSRIMRQGSEASVLQYGRSSTSTIATTEIMPAESPSSPLQRAILKDSNITVIADGLNTALLSTVQLPQFGPPKSVFQLPQVGVVDFGKLSFLVFVDQRRA